VLRTQERQQDKMASFKLFFLALAFVAISHTLATPMADASVDMENLMAEMSEHMKSPMAEMSEDMAEDNEFDADDVTGNPIPLGTTEKYESAAEESDDEGFTGNPIPLGTTAKDESAAEESAAEERQRVTCIYYYWYGRWCKLCFWCVRFGNYSRCYYRRYC